MISVRMPLQRRDIPFSTLPMKKDKVYFISDAHIGGGKFIRPPRVREDALIDFLRAIRKDAECLYIVGDLFDFWFEYRSVVPAHGARVIFELYHLVQSGTRVIYLPGNHDSWLGGYLSEQVGVELPGPFCDVAHQNRRLYVTHGDIFQQNWKFELRRRILSHPLCIALFRWLHPDIGAYLARLVSRSSDVGTKKGVRINKKTYLPSYFLKSAGEKIAEGFDFVICGHYHALIVEPIDGGTLVVLGDWMRYDAYAVLEHGEIALKHWHTAPELRIKNWE